ncbi:AAA family ATPase [Frigidibacter sp. RF13]|uniref:ATP-dependent nuclease n=1 Tax=Frigidibacter sp. RF13 TaxID=2997340 RepID=UPI00226E77B8|nr:AAA family ATPase [Frigidibacter sp. RF13]MCY1126293.1 AAA family ATPase [Frigidibacter sp. RF13]
MKLVSFSVENYRSITAARKIPLSDYSLLIGANNEGKSNILHALTLAMNTLVDWHQSIRRTIDGRVIKVMTGPVSGRYSRSGYNWETDFPISKQDRANATSTTNITLEFELDEAETLSFKEEVKSNLNGTLPLMISFGPDQLNVSIKKPGRGQASLTKKGARIADFISQRVNFEYIPAIRTAEAASKVISQLVERELFRLESDPQFQTAVSRIDELQKPIFDDLASTIQSTITNFLPSVKSVELKGRQEARYRSLRRDVEIVIDDGNLTRLERKGDGVQSLVALALMRHASAQSARKRRTIIAIEEPESHLHPRAVHELRVVIEALAQENQVVLTSHSPLFVDPNNLRNTVIVKGSKAAPAAHVSEVREALGVRFSDNLQNARLVLLVEGTNDVTALRPILSARNEMLESALRNGTITFDHLGTASALRQKASFYQAGACGIQCFLDGDKAGRAAVDKAIGDRVINLRDANLCTVPHLQESELEDLYDRTLYGQTFLDEFGVDPRRRPAGKAKEKWSDAIGRLFRDAGKPWNDDIKAEVKGWLAKFAAANASQIVKSELEGPLNSFIETVVAKLPKT